MTTCTCKNMPTVIKMERNRPQTTYIQGIGHVRVDLREAVVKFKLDSITFGPFSFSENEDRILYMLSHIARETNRVPFADVTLSGDLEYREKNPLTLYVSLLEFNCSIRQLQNETAQEERERETSEKLCKMLP